MSSTNSNQMRAPHKYRVWLSVAATAALVAGSATMTMAAPRNQLRAGSARTAMSFRWQSFNPKSIVRIDRPGGSQSSNGDVQTDALRASTLSFTWQQFSPGHIVHNDRPNGSNPGTGGSQTDALRAPSTTFSWRRYSPPYLVSQPPVNGMDGSNAGNLSTEAMRARASRPSLFLGADRDGAGGVRAEIGLSFRIR